MADTGVHYQIQVSRRSDFSGEIVWDSGQRSMSSVADGERCQDIEYTGSPLPLDGTTYYWRIRFWNEVGNVSPWSTETAYFTMAEEAPIPPGREEPPDAVGKVKKARLPLLSYKRELIWSRLLTPPARVILDP